MSHFGGVVEPLHYRPLCGARRGVCGCACACVCVGVRVCVCVCVHGSGEDRAEHFSTMNAHVIVVRAVC
jgi:hypothetical protein